MVDNLYKATFDFQVLKSAAYTKMIKEENM